MSSLEMSHRHLFRFDTAGCWSVWAVAVWLGFGCFPTSTWAQSKDPKDSSTDQSKNDAKDAKKGDEKDTKKEKDAKKKKDSTPPIQKSLLEPPGQPYPENRRTSPIKPTRPNTPGQPYIPLSKQQGSVRSSGSLPGEPYQGSDTPAPVRRVAPPVRQPTTDLQHKSAQNSLVVDPSTVNQHRFGQTQKVQRVDSQGRDSELEEIRKQLRSDPVPIPPKLGGVFVPNIISGQNVRPTSYVIFDSNNRRVAIAQTGRKAFVFPGWYTLRIGQQATDFLPTYKIFVREGKLTLIRPRWAALIVRVVDERLIQFRNTYDLIHLDSRRGIGSGIGADDTLGEKVRPWLLPPGMYMIVRVGGTYLDRTNYFTVQLNQGQVTRFQLVVDRNTGAFLGGGVIVKQVTQRSSAPSNWQWSLQFSGSLLWNQIENIQNTIPGHSFNVTTFLFGRVTYNSPQHFFLTTLNAELGFTVPVGQDIRKSSDRLELQSIYIWRFSRFFGPYVRAGLETNMIPNEFLFAPNDPRLFESSSIYRCNDTSCHPLSPNSLNQAPGELKKFQLSGPFDPFLFSQGIGINLQAVQTSYLDLRILGGLGFRQELAREVYQFNSNKDIGSTRCKDPNKRNPLQPVDLSGCADPAEQEKHTTVVLLERLPSHREGVELAVVATGQISRYVSFTTELNALVQFNFTKFNLDINWRSSVTFRLSQYVAVIYRLRVARDSSLKPDPLNPELSLWSLDQSALLSLTLLL